MKVLGSVNPRLYTKPLEEDAYGLPRHTRGKELIKWARDFGEPLWTWEEELALRGLEVDPSTGCFRFRILVVLVARQNGKTTFMRLLALWRLFADGAQLVVAAGQDRSRAFEVWENALESIESHPVYGEQDVEFPDHGPSKIRGLARVWRRTNDEYFRVRDENGKPAGFYRIKAATRGSGRGPSADLVPFDELREQSDWAGWAALSKTTMARANGQVWGFSNAGDLKAVVLAHLRAVALAGTDPAVGIMEWSAPDGCALDDPEMWAQANPSLNRPNGITEAAIKTALHSDPPEIFRTEVLCQFVDVLDHAVDVLAWNTSADPTLDQYRDDWCACVDVAPDGEHVTLALAALLPDGRIRTMVAAAWESRPNLPATEQARRILPSLLNEIKPRKVAWYPGGPAKSLANLFRNSEKYVEIKGAQVSESCMGFADLVSSRLIVHDGEKLLTAHVTGAQRLPEGDGWRFVRSGAAHVDAAYAAAGAVHLARAQPPAPVRPRLILPRMS